MADSVELMPYVKREKRPELKPVAGRPAETEGELNFQITCLLNDYMLHHELEYDRMGDCTSACENAAHEFRRRIMDPYEEAKQFVNGDVYDVNLLKALSSLFPF